MNISWSLIQTFLSCQRKYELTYLEGLSKPSGDQYNLFLGSAFHAGIEFALAAYANDMADYVLPEVDVAGAVDAALQQVKDATVLNKTIYDREAGGTVPDRAYYAMMQDVRNEVPKLLRYHIPLMGIGTKYVPVTKGEIFGRSSEWFPVIETDKELALEMRLKFPIEGTDDFITGIVDAVLRDIETDELIVFDWKTRGVFPYDSLAQVDGQLSLYAAVLNAMGANITRTIMYQFSTKLPSPASISAKNSRPNVGAASYSTTWEVWKATLPPNISPEKYEAEIRPKLMLDSDFQHPVECVVTEYSTKMAFDNVYATLEAIQNAKKSKYGFPAILGSNGCKFCDFLPLCANALKFGGDVSELIERDYIREVRKSS